MVAKTIDTLVEDIQGLFDNGHVLLGTGFGVGLEELLSSRLRGYQGTRANGLRVSNLGRPDRQVWYEINNPTVGERLPANVKTKFLFGDLWESVLLMLAEEAGHVVTHQQVEVDINGIKGHPDAIIDGVVVDVKSCSTYSYRKFSDGSLRDGDAFGYIPQLAGYVHALTPGQGGAFLAVDKTTGSICLLKVSAEELAAVDIPALVEHKKKIVSGEIPERCYEAVPEGKSGNLKLAVGCSYCGFRQHCWADSNGGRGLRTFLYSSGPVFLTHVERVPNVFEVGVDPTSFPDVLDG